MSCTIPVGQRLGKQRAGLPDRYARRATGLLPGQRVGSLSYFLDFGCQADELRALLTVADIVIEGSRPAALVRRRLGPDDSAGLRAPGVTATGPACCEAGGPAWR